MAVRRVDMEQAVELSQRLMKREEHLQSIMKKQAEDDGLWFRAVTAAEGYLQQELRRLHAAIEETS